jgi:hypothetical protein
MSKAKLEKEIVQKYFQNFEARRASKINQLHCRETKGE